MLIDTQREIVTMIIRALLTGSLQGMCAAAFGRLGLGSVFPVGVSMTHRVSGSQIDAEASGPRTQQEDKDVRPTGGGRGHTQIDMSKCTKRRI